MLVRPSRLDDRTAIWSILEPTIRAGETYALPQDMTEAAAMAYWTGHGHETFVAEAAGAVVGVYFLCANQAGGGAHVANCGYMTAGAATGRGVARAMGHHSLEQARTRGFTAMQFNFVVSTNTRAVALWKGLGFAIVGRLPLAFRHPHLGFVDAFIMFKAL